MHQYIPANLQTKAAADIPRAHVLSALQGIENETKTTLSFAPGNNVFVGST
jgi:hypothetical protein